MDDLEDFIAADGPGSNLARPVAALGFIRARPWLQFLVILTQEVLT